MRSTMRFAQERTIPKGSKEHTYLDMTYYTYVNKGLPCVIAYTGKRTKADFHYRFLNIKQRDEHIARWKKNHKAALKAVEDRKKAKAAFKNPLKVGDVLHGSWGYDQTNCEFFEVLEVSGRAVVIGELHHVSQKSSGLSDMADYVKPDLSEGHHVGEPKRKIVQSYDGKGCYVKLHSCCTLHPWDGNKCYSSWYG